MAVAGAVPPLRCGLTHAARSSALCATAAATTTPGWPSTRRGPGTAPRCCATPPPQHAGPPRWVRTARPPPSSSGPSGSPAGRRRRRGRADDGLAMEAALVDRWRGRGGRPGAGARAVAGRRATGCARATALRQLSRAMWRLCRGRARPCAAAEARVAPSSRSARASELAWAYVEPGRPPDAGQCNGGGDRAGPAGRRRSPSRSASRRAQRRAQHRGLRGRRAGR